MDKDMTPLQGAIWAGLAAASSVLGWRGILTVIWLAAMALDYFSGTLSAVKGGEWSSLKAREGLWHKGGTLLVVLAAVLLDVLLKTVQQTGLIAFPFDYQSLFTPVVMAGYVVTEIGSVIENAALLGAPIPAWLRKAIKIAGEAAERAGDAISGPEDIKDGRSVVGPDEGADASDSERSVTENRFPLREKRSESGEDNA